LFRASANCSKVRLIKGLFQFVLAGVLWLFLLGWAVHLWSVLDAALWKPKS